MSNSQPIGVAYQDPYLNSAYIENSTLLNCTLIGTGGSGLHGVQSLPNLPHNYVGQTIPTSFIASQCFTITGNTSLPIALAVYNLPTGADLDAAFPSVPVYSCFPVTIIAQYKYLVGLAAPDPSTSLLGFSPFQLACSLIFYRQAVGSWIFYTLYSTQAPT
jgi:hypothetical protein